jgi:hypothetical protein
VLVPKAWYDKIRLVTQQHGSEADLLDIAIFRMKSGDSVILGVLAIYMDDTIGGDTSKFLDMINAVSKDLNIGSKETGSFHFKGLRVSTVHSRDFEAKYLDEIIVDGDEYLDSTLPISVSSGLCDEDLLPPADITKYRSDWVVLGIWHMEIAFRLGLTLEASLLGEL